MKPFLSHLQTNNSHKNCNNSLIPKIWRKREEKGWKLKSKTHQSMEKVRINNIQVNAITSNT